MPAKIRKHLNPAYLVALCLSVMLAALSALATNADVVGPGNTPRPDVVDQGGNANAKGYSWDPQICFLTIDSTGVTAATTGLTVFSSSTHMTGGAYQRGKVTSSPTNGTCLLNKSGVYRAHFESFCSATTADVSSIRLSTTPDDSTYTDVATLAIDHLTGILGSPISENGIFQLSTTAAAAGTFHVVARGSNTAHTTTCVGGVLSVERLDQLQPVANP